MINKILILSRLFLIISGIFLLADQCLIGILLVIFGILISLIINNED